MKDAYILISYELWGMKYYAKLRDIADTGQHLADTAVLKSNVFGGNDDKNLSHSE